MRSLVTAVLAVAQVALANMPPPAPPVAADAKAAPVAPAEPAAAPSAADVVTRLDTLWKTRDDAASIKEFNELSSQGLKTYPDNYDLLWRVSRFRWWQADGTTAEKLKKQVAKEGWALAERALKANPQGSEGKYYTALNIGAYSQAVGILTALGEGLEGKFVDNLDAAGKANEDFDRAGYYSAKGRYYWELPWPKRDLGKSREHLTKYITKHPEVLRGYYYLAATELKDGNAKKAREYIDKALSGSSEYDPPEARRVKAWAKDLSPQIEEALK